MWDWIDKAAELQNAGRPFAIVTVLGTKGSAPREAGAKLIVEPDGHFYGTIGGGRLEAVVLEDARKAMHEVQGMRGRYPLCLRTGQCCGGSVETLVEPVGFGPKLYIFGAGHVGRSLAATMEGTPFQVHLIDERPEWLEDGQNGAAGHSSLSRSVCRHPDWRAFLQTAPFDRDLTYAVVMTHEHDLDLEIIAALAKRPARYLGLIGSATKWERFRRRLAAFELDEDQIGRIECPIGIHVGGKTPREVAISAAARLLKLHHDV